MAKILVVDDDPSIVRVVQLALQSKGYEVLTANSREEGEAAAVAGKPDLMIVDVMMPGGTEGFHLVWKIRQAKDEKLRDVPIIMSTGIHETTKMRFYPDETDGTYAPGEFLPVQAWLDKPVHVEKLRKKVTQLLGE